MLMIFSGFDPSGGAGILQDITIMKMFQINPGAVISAYTVQNEKNFKKVIYREKFDEFKLFDNITLIKVGLSNLKQIVELRNNYKNAKIIWNPVIKTSSGFNIISPEEVKKGEKYVDLMIMNSEEYKLAKVSCDVIITGGHEDTEKIKVLYKNKVFYAPKYNKNLHGTGCVFSSLIVAFLYNKYTIEESIIASLYYMDKLVKNSENYVKTENMVYEFHKSYILEELWKIKTEIIKLGQYTIPEVGQNIVFAMPNAKCEDDVGKYPGRIYKFGNEVNFTHEPAFFGKSHMARAVLATMKYFPWIRSAMNIKYKEDYIKRAEKLGYRTFYLDRNKEPVEIRVKEGHSIPYGLSKIYEQVKEPIDFVWDDGFYGKEAMIRVFGRTPSEVINKVKDVVGVDG
ncbi:bifunctional hydroxymethylpyrimidine kinase/phosphomethylpyrimidine kinase [Thermosipho ferrireducens]|uniref:Bifunctional hydroxymethylpyrimidine kinase/phosphomethylpyrimidine kinase n=1 Tax=Thermosipho ferrireducens TaxID=2571116 RepID=A0ABX7S8H8_9BACT|nr:thiamine-phosphate synthase family protein [Thermosipho ferrireducens]QTA37922.1 bifunctional hydroxymethylpyrimidine kinase/phosphomethylpyrimidine kinase [Thermosipho ferrireducens]